LFAVVFAGVGSLSGTAANAAPRLSGYQISALFPARIAGIAFGRGNRESRRFTARVKANGKIKMRVSFVRDRGRWYVSGSRLCIQFKFIQSGKLKCRAMRRYGTWIHLLRRNGTTKMKFRVIGR